MEPVKSNKSTCLKSSTNCVDWEGGELTGIQLCNTDSVGDVIKKVNTVVQQLVEELDLTAFDYDCLASACSTCPEPDKTLISILNAIKDKVCSLEQLVGNPGTPYVEPTMNLAVCVQYFNDLDVLVTQLPLSQYVTKIGTKLCQINDITNENNSRINLLEDRVEALENQTPGSTYTPPTVTPTCILPALPTAMNVVLSKLEKDFCTLKSAVGEPTAILQAVGKQCTGLSASASLSRSGTMGALPGWKTQSVTASDAINNLWLTICDIRDAVIGLKDCCGTVDCSSFILGFTANASEDRSTVTLYFFGTTVIPSGFTNCTLAGSKVTISDSSGNTYISTVDLIAAAQDTDGIAFDVSTSALNSNLTFTVTVEGCLTKDGTVCSKTATQNVIVPCPIVTGVTATLS